MSIQEGHYSWDSEIGCTDPNATADPTKEDKEKKERDLSFLYFLLFVSGVMTLIGTFIAVDVFLLT